MSTGRTTSGETTRGAAAVTTPAPCNGASGLRMFGADEFTGRLRQAGFTEVSQEIHGVAQYVAATAPA